MYSLSTYLVNVDIYKVIFVSDSDNLGITQ